MQRLEGLIEFLDVCYPDIDKWLKENNINFQILKSYGGNIHGGGDPFIEINGYGYVILFVSEEDALAFKLRWL